MADKDKPAGKVDVQAGVDTSAPPPAETKRRTRAKFDEADAKAEPSQDDKDEARIGRQVRGW